MGRMTYFLGITEDRESVALEMREDGVALAHMYLDGTMTEKLILDLAQVRANLAEPVTPELDPGARLPAEPQPAWRVAPHGDQPGKVLALRHHGIGWLAFLLEKDRAEAIGKSLLAP